MLDFNDKNILIVGGAGFVGSNLAHMLLDHKINCLTIIDNLLSSERDNIPNDPRCIFIEGSITEDIILEQIPSNTHYIFHLSCYHGNQSSIANPLEDHTNNTLTTLKLCDYIHKNLKYLEKFVYAAAGCAVAEKTFEHTQATVEDAPVSLYHDSPYSISKIIGELYGNYYWQQYSLPFVKARFQNVYGPREILGAGQWRGTIHTIWRNVTPTFIWKALHHEALPLENGGKNSRDFIFVEDMARGLMHAAYYGNNGDVYNLASGHETSILDLANIINEIANNLTPHIIKEARNWDNSGCRFGSIEKSYHQLNFRAQISIRAGLEKTILWTKENYDLIARNIEKHHDMVN